MPPGYTLHNVKCYHIISSKGPTEHRADTPLILPSYSRVTYSKCHTRLANTQHHFPNDNKHTHPSFKFLVMSRPKHFIQDYCTEEQ